MGGGRRGCTQSCAGVSLDGRPPRGQACGVTSRESLLPGPRHSAIQWTRGPQPLRGALSTGLWVPRGGPSCLPCLPARACTAGGILLAEWDSICRGPRWTGPHEALTERDGTQGHHCLLFAPQLAAPCAWTLMASLSSLGFLAG